MRIILLVLFGVLLGIMAPHPASADPIQSSSPTTVPLNVLQLNSVPNVGPKVSVPTLKPVYVEDGRWQLRSTGAEVSLPLLGEWQFTARAVTTIDTSAHGALADKHYGAVDHFISDGVALRFSNGPGSAVQFGITRYF